MTLKQQFSSSLPLAAGAFAMLVAMAVGTSSANAQVAEISKAAADMYPVAVTNGFVLYQGLGNKPTLNEIDTDNEQQLKLLQQGYGGAIGQQLDISGMTFGPCTPGANNRCQATTVDGTPGIGIGFGQVWIPGSSGPGAEIGGWVSDDTLHANITNGQNGNNQNGEPGGIAAVSIDPTNGSFAVGWHTDSVSGMKHGLIWQLDANYTPIGAGIDLAPVGTGQISSATASALNSSFVVGVSDFSPKLNFGHAVYAALGPTPATSWSDATSVWPTTALGYTISASKSQALAVNNSGMIAGTVTVTEKNVAGHKSIPLPIGFVQSVNPLGAPVFFDLPGGGDDVIPLKVLANGDVVGDIYVEPTAGSGVQGSYHPFVFDGTTLTDLLTQSGAFSGPKSGSFTSAAPFSCRVNNANNVGEMVGTCVATDTSPYNVSATAFYINAQPAAGATFEDLNAELHTNFDCANNSSPVPPCVQFFSKYNFGVSSAIDDQHEVVILGSYSYPNGTVQRGSWLIQSAGY